MNKVQKFLVAVFFLIFCCIPIMGCNAAEIEKGAVNQEKQIEKRDEYDDVVCYWYVLNGNGYWVYQGKCLGYGVPYGAKPEVKSAEYFDYVYGGNNGLYTKFTYVAPQGMWISVITEEGDVHKRLIIDTQICVSEEKMPDELCDENSLPLNY